MIHTRNGGMWNGANWSYTTSLQLGSMAFDVARGRLVSTFGTYGANSTNVAEWDGTQWTVITPPASPGGGGSLAYDPTRRLYPEHLAAQIDRWNEIIYPSVNNGVYKAGFARTQVAYDAAVVTLFETLDLIEEQLSRVRVAAPFNGYDRRWRSP